MSQSEKMRSSTSEARPPSIAPPPKSAGIAPHLALIMVQVLFGTWPIVGKIALRSLPSTGLVAFRVMGGAIALTLMQQFRKKRGRIARRDLGLLALCSLLGVTLNQLFFVKGLSLTTVINATLLGTTIPIFALLVGAAFGLDTLSWRKFIGTAIAGSGVIYLIDPWRADFSRATTIGNLLIVANSFAYGAYIAISKGLVKRHGALTVITWLFLMGCVVTIPLGAGTLSRAPMSSWGWDVWLALLYIVLVPTVGAYYLNAWALARVEPSTVAVYIYLQPLIAFALAPLILGEAWNARTVIACLLIFSGVLVVTRRGRTIEEVAEHPDALGH